MCTLEMHLEDEAVCIVDVCVFMCIYVHKYMPIYRYRLRCRCRYGYRYKSNYRYMVPSESECNAL